MKFKNQIKELLICWEGGVVPTIGIWCFLVIPGRIVHYIWGVVIDIYDIVLFTAFRGYWNEKNLKLKPAILALRGLRHILTKLVLIIWFYFNIRRKLSVICSCTYIIFQYGWEPVIIQRILFGKKISKCLLILKVLLKYFETEEIENLIYLPVTYPYILKLK